MGNRFILGLDISTTCTGVSIVYVDENDNIKPIVVTHLRPKIPTKIKGVEALFMKCNLFMDKLEEILKENKLEQGFITDIVIEEPLLSSNNQNTVATLLRYNGMVAYRVYNLLKVVPKFISSYDARMYGVPSLMAVRKFNKKGDCYPESKVRQAINKNELVLFGDYPFDCAKKLILWNYVSDRFPGISWVYDKDGDLRNENFDASDSLICVLGYIGQEKFGDTKPEVVCSSKNKNEYEYTYRFCNQMFTKKIEWKGN